MTPSFDLKEEERDIFLKFYDFLDRTEVGEIIKRYENNNTKSGGRPNVNYYNLLATILYGFATRRDTLREIEEACNYDIRFISMMEQIRPDHSTISLFINKVVVPNEKEIFKLINNQLIKEMKVNLDDAFIDGTKFEANANKYKFVWKPTTFHKRLTSTFFSILQENEICQDFHYEEFVKSSTIALSISRLSQEKDRFNELKYTSLMKTLNSLLVKVLEYEEKESICGPNRNSYYKTDYDATAMTLKTDYYSGLGTNTHAAYNTQILVSEGIVCSYLVSQERTDIREFINVLDLFKWIYDRFPVNVCADAGYGSQKNYKYLKDNDIGNYVKHTSWEGNASGRNPDCYTLNESNNTIVCLNGNIGVPVDIPNRHPKNKNGQFFKIEGCNSCEFRYYCKKYQKILDEDFKIFELSIEFLKEKQKAERNLLSAKGIELRVNRSVQVEGVFGIVKQNAKYTRTRRRGLNRVSTEIMLTFLGHNIRKLFDFYRTNKRPNFWIAPKDLKDENFKKPSAKRLSKKGTKINNKIFKN